MSVDAELLWRTFLDLMSRGLEDEARCLLTGLGEAHAARARSLLEAETPAEASEDEPGDDELLDVALLERAPEAVQDRAVIATFLRWFGMRADLYARQWFDERRRRTGYHPVEQPLTPEVVRDHLEGRITVGQYLLDSRGEVSAGIIDLDLDGAELLELRSRHGADVSGLAHSGLAAYARRLLEAGTRLGLPLFAEDSGSKGVHVWLFLEPRRPARAVRALLAQIVTVAGNPPPSVGVELFPKQDRLGPRGLSSLVKLPLGIHQATLRRCALLDEELHPVESSSAALGRLQAAPVDIVADLLGRRLAALPAPELEPRDPPPALPQQPHPRSLAEILRAVPAGPEATQACESILAGCAVLRRLVRTAYETRRLDATEARIIVYTLGLVGPRPQLAEDTLVAAQVSRKELERARRGLPSPTGCAKIGALVAQPGECPCSLDPRTPPYATPVQHAVGAVAAAPPTWKPFASHVEGGELEVEDPLRTLADSLRRIEERLEKMAPGS